MPKARKKKNSSFQTTITKSVFLYGRPNKEKLAVLRQMQNSYTALINRDIELLEKNPDIVLQLVKNNKKDSQMRKLEKAIRPEGINSAFCQNAFDAAVVQVSGRLNNIRLDLLSEGMGIFAQSKVLFAMSIMGCSKQKMEETIRQIEGTFYEDCTKTLHEMSEKEFSDQQLEFQERYASKSLEYRVPKLRFVSVPLDSRLMKIEQSTDTKIPYVIIITNPLKTRQRITIPIDTSSHFLHKIQNNKMAGTVLMQVRKGNLRIGWSYDSTRQQPATTNCIGVDTGISDCFHTSDGRKIGSMSPVIDFYHEGAMHRMGVEISFTIILHFFKSMKTALYLECKLFLCIQSCLQMIHCRILSVCLHKFFVRAFFCDFSVFDVADAICFSRGIKAMRY